MTQPEVLVPTQDDGKAIPAPDQRAIEEWKLLQAVIARQEDLVFRIRGYNYALLTAFSAGLIAGRIAISGWLFLAIGWGVALAFLWMELAQRVGLKRAIERSKGVEQALRSGSGYDGPLLASTLTEPVRLGAMFRYLLKNEMIWVPTLAVVIVVALLAVFVHHRPL
jgi:hypothetical protein